MMSKDLLNIIKILENQGILKNIEDTKFYEYYKLSNCLFYINFEGKNQININESSILWNKSSSNIIISANLDNNSFYIGDTRTYRKGHQIKLEKDNNNILEIKNALIIGNDIGYEKIISLFLNHIALNIENGGNIWKEINKLTNNNQKNNTVNKYLLNNLEEVFDIIKNKNIKNIDENVIKIILQMIFMCYLVDNKFIDNKTDINKIKDIKIILNQINKKFNGDLFKNIDFWDNLDQEIFLVIKKVFFKRKWDLTAIKSSFWDLYDFKYIPILLISNIYEGLLAHIHTKSNKKNLGIFYTKPNLVKSILNRYLFYDLDKYDYENSFPHILDPACGSGVFLVGAFEMIIEHIEKKKKIDFEKKKEILQKIIYGIDLDSNALYITEFSLYLSLLKGYKKEDFENEKLPNLIFEKNLQNGDSLLGGKLKNNKLEIIDNLEEIKFYDTKKGEIKFSHVFGNPPWTGDLLSKEYIKKLNNKGIFIGDKQISQAFILCTKSYLDKNGKAILIVNSSNFYNLDSEHFRKILFENFLVKELVILNDLNPFENANKPATIITFNNSKKKNYNIEIIKLEKSYLSDKFNIYNIISNNLFLSIDNFVDNNLLNIFYKGDVFDFNLIKYIANGNLLLNNFLNQTKNIKSEDMTQGIIVKGGDKDGNPYIYDNKISKRYSPIISSTDLNKYGYTTKKYIDYNAISSHFRRPKTLELFQGKKIFISRTFKQGKILCVYTDKLIFTRDSINIIKLNKKNEKYYYYITGLLNSELLTYYNYFNGKTSKGENPEIKTSIIKNIPIPNLDENDELFIKISNLSKDLHKLYSNNILNNGINKQIIDKELELKQYVLIAYKIFSDIDKQIIEDYFDNQENGNKNIKKENLNQYAKLFVSHFTKSRAGILLQREGLIGKDIKYITSENNYYGLSWICFSFNKDLNITENLKDLNKCLLKNSLQGNNIFDGIKISRVFIKNKSYLFIIKPNKKKYWTKSNAYKDSLFENKLIFDSLKIK